MKEENEDNSFLPLFITEPVYLFDEKEPAKAASVKPAASAPVTEPESVTKPPQEEIETPAVKTKTTSTETEDAVDTSVETKVPATEHETTQDTTPPQEPIAEMPEPLPPLPFEGKNLKSILLATDGKPGTEERDLLKKILGAVGLSMDDVALTDVRDLHDPATLPPHRLIISFGVRNPVLFAGKTPPPYQIQIIEDTKVLLSNSLTRICKDVEAKKNLWGSLKKLFVA